MVTLKYLFLCMHFWSCVRSVEVNTEAEPSSGSNGLGAALHGPGAALSLLLDIRDLLAGWSRPPQQHHDQALWRTSLDDHRKTTDKTVELLNESLERVSSGVTQKMELIMESFGALKMLVQAQEAQLMRLHNIVEKVQGRTDSLDDRTRDFRLSLEALETRFLKEDHENPSDLSSTERSPEELHSKILSIDDRNTNKTNNGKSSNHSQEESSVGKDLQICLHEVKNEVASLKLKIQNIDINTTTSGNRHTLDHGIQNIDINTTTSGNRHTLDDGIQNIDMNTTTSGNIPTLAHGYHSNATRIENIVNNLERIQTRQQVSLDAANYKVSMVDDLVMRIQTIYNVTSFYSYRMNEMQDTINGLNAMKGDIGTIKKNVNDVRDNVENVISNITDINKDIEHMKSNMKSRNVTNSVVTKGLCVHPYQRGAGGCFYVHTNNRLGWRQSREHCRTIQGDLAAPGNYTSFKNYLLAQRLSRSYTYWVGASDTEEEGVWKWVDGRQVEMGTAVWQSGQPNEGTQANCMEIKPAYKYVAADDTCKAQNYFICEQER